MSHNYVPLYELLDDWASQSGELPEIVLKNLNEHDAHGNFPAGTFQVRGSGQPCESGTLAELIDTARPGGFEIVRHEAAHALEHLAVAKAGILAFCKSHDVQRPPCLLPTTGIWKRLFGPKPQHLAPPPYPSTPEEIAAERVKREQQEAFEEARFNARLANDVEHTLGFFESAIERIVDLIQEDDYTDREDWAASHLASADRMIQQITDTQCKAALASRLEELRSRFARATNQVLDDSEKATGEDAQPAEAKLEGRSVSTARAENRARRYLQEQVQLENWQPKQMHFKRAYAEIGSTLSERAFERAWCQIAPLDWKKPGRRPAQ